MKNTILLLNFLPATDDSYQKKGSIYPSTASMLIGTVLKNKGYSVKIIDGAYHENYLELLKDSLNDDVIYVGMTVMTTQIPFALEAAKVIKQTKRIIPVIWGGPHPTLFPKQVLQNNNIDIVVINEGAITSVELADTLKNRLDLNTIKGIGYKDENRQLHFTEARDLDNFEELPYLDFSLIELDHYLNTQSPSVYQREFPHYDGKIKLLPILTALGCPYKCTFCINVILKRKYRMRSALSIVEEIKTLMKEYDVNTFLFFDEDFFVNKNRALEFLSLIEKEHLHFNWRMWCRVDHFKENYINNDFIERLARVGHGSLVMGGESANQTVLDNLCKGITPEQIKHSLNVISRTKNITPRYSFMVGLENETMDEIINTYRFCLELIDINPDVDIAGPFIFRLYPGSLIYDRLVNSYNVNNPETLEEWIIFLKEEVSFTKIPWTPNQFQRNKHIIQFYFDLASIRSKNKIKPFKNLIYYIIIKTAKIRIKYCGFSFPFEYWLLTWYLSRQNPK